MSSSNQHQFRYTQTPSKVLHFRNLLWECSDEELADLCSPFGKIVNTKCNVGANQNQAFVEFVDINQAISMVSYYAASSEPAQVRGKTVYIQYSNRHETVNSKGPGDVPGNVLLVTFDAHRDLNIKFQSNRSRDYTNPMLPVNQTTIDSALQSAIRPDVKRKELESNVLLATIENMQYAVTVEVLNTVFSALGTVQKIAIFEKNGQTQTLIQYPDVTIAASAKEALEGHNIYDGGYCKLHLTHSRHTDLNVKAFSEKSRDYTVLNPSLHPTQAPAWQNTQAAPMYPGGLQGQMPSWDQDQQDVTQSYLSAPGTFPSGQAIPSIPGYSPSAVPPSNPLRQHRIEPSQQLPSPFVQYRNSPQPAIRSLSVKPKAVAAYIHERYSTNPAATSTPLH
ncbi:hypothetical protein RYX36_010658 [Vicia faba]